MYSFIILLLTSLTFVITGYWTYRRPPKEPSMYYGYRTKRSRSSQEAWEFAQSYSSNWMIKSGYAMGIIGAFYLLLPQTDTILWSAIIISVLGCFIPIYLTEKALKEKFNL